MASGQQPSDYRKRSPWTNSRTSVQVLVTLVRTYSSTTVRPL